MDKPLAKQKKKKTKKMQVTNIKNEIENITIDTSGIKIITRKYCEQLYTSGFDTRKKWSNSSKKKKKSRALKIHLI